MASDEPDRPTPSDRSYRSAMVELETYVSDDFVVKDDSKLWLALQLAGVAGRIATGAHYLTGMRARLKRTDVDAHRVAERFREGTPQQLAIAVHVLLKLARAHGVHLPSAILAHVEKCRLHDERARREAAAADQTQCVCPKHGPVQVVIDADAPTQRLPKARAKGKTKAKSRPSRALQRKPKR